jgi:hypothetical protein
LMRVMSIRVVAVDVGAVGPPPKFAWRGLTHPPVSRAGQEMTLGR